MSQRIIKVILLQTDEAIDILQFVFDDDLKMNINLNSDSCQTDIKAVFAKILELEMTDEISLDFMIDENFKKELYKEVCKEYIEEIEREINLTREHIKKELS